MESRRGDAVAILVVYVVPLTAVTVALLAVGLPRLALALLAVEAVVVAAVLAAKRRPDARPAPSTRPWLVPLVMVGLLGLMVAGAVAVSLAG